MVVDKTSATLGYPDEISTSLNADHHTVCKFDSTQDSNYISVRNALKTLVTTIRTAGKWNDAWIRGRIKARTLKHFYVQSYPILRGLN